MTSCSCKPASGRAPRGILARATHQAWTYGWAGHSDWIPEKREAVSTGAGVHGVNARLLYWFHPRRGGGNPRRPESGVEAPAFQDSAWQNTAVLLITMSIAE